jgi:hypothetical protein
MRFAISTAIPWILICVGFNTADDNRKAPQSPPPDFVVLVATNAEMGLVTYQQVFWEGQLDQKTFEVTKWTSKAVQKQFQLAKAIFTEVGGTKALVKDEVAKRLKAGAPLLLTRDGKGLDPYYASVYKPGTLVVAVGK